MHLDVSVILISAYTQVLRFQPASTISICADNVFRLRYKSYREVGHVISSFIRLSFFFFFSLQATAVTVTEQKVTIQILIIAFCEAKIYLYRILHSAI